MKVVFIDQEEFVCRLVAGALRRDGMEVTTLSRDEEIVDYEYLVEDLAPDMVIIDIDSFKFNLNNFHASNNAHVSEFKKFSEGGPLSHIRLVALLNDKEETLNDYEATKHLFQGKLIKPLSPTELGPKLRGFLKIH